MHVATWLSNSYLRCRARVGVIFGMKKIGVLGLLLLFVGGINQSAEASTLWIIVKNGLKPLFNKD